MVGEWTVWVCAQGVCAPIMAQNERPVPFCRCRVEAKRRGFYHYEDRVLVKVVPAAELENARVALRELRAIPQVAAHPAAVQIIKDVLDEG